MLRAAEAMYSRTGLVIFYSGANFDGLITTSTSYIFLTNGYTNLFSIPNNGFNNISPFSSSTDFPGAKCFW